MCVSGTLTLPAAPALEGKDAGPLTPTQVKGWYLLTSKRAVL